MGKLAVAQPFYQRTAVNNYRLPLIVKVKWFSEQV
jgi:hypothetical protein